MDYELLRHIWWLLLGVLLIGLAVTDGFDMGVSMWLPFLGKNDQERRIIINTVGPVWEGNQVWLILGGGAIFAAWPPLYAVAFSGFYLAMFIVLSSLILRPVAFKFRSKLENQKWRSVWDIMLFIGGFVPSLIFGVAVGNALQGVPFVFDDTLRVTYKGTFFGLLNPFALAVGLMSVFMMLMQGAAYMSLKADQIIAQRARQALMPLSLIILIGFILVGSWAAHLNGYKITSVIDPNAASNPLHKIVELKIGALFDNFKNHSWMYLAPLFVVLGTLGVWSSRILSRDYLSFIGSSLCTVGFISTVGLSLYPFLLPSSLDLKSSLTIWDASSSQSTLFIMLVAVIIFLPIVLAYTAWAYKVLFGRVTKETLDETINTY